MEKYIKQLESVHLFDVNPSSIIFSSQADMLNIIRNFSKQQQDACRDIRRKGRNKVHALKCRKKSKDELTMLQEQVKAMKQEKERQMRRKEEEEKKLNQPQELHIHIHILQNLHRNNSLIRILHSPPEMKTNRDR